MEPGWHEIEYPYEMALRATGSGVEPITARMAYERGLMAIPAPLIMLIIGGDHPLAPAGRDVTQAALISIDHAAGIAARLHVSAEKLGLAESFDDVYAADLIEARRQMLDGSDE